MRRAAAVGVACAALLAALGPARPVLAAPPPSASATPVEQHFAEPGPYEVRHEVVEDSFGDTPYEMFLPTDLGAPGERHPVVAWGNGTIAHPVDYAGLLTHLASWGFLVIASTFDQVGTGDEILASIHRIERFGDDPTSPLFGHVDREHIGVAGHSQGAGGSIRAATAEGTPVTAAMTFELPNQVFTFPPDTKDFHPERLRVPTLFFGGSDDGLISGPETNRHFFDLVPGGAAMAVLTGADHNTVQHAAGRFPGYATAWLRFTLAADPLAAQAFAGPRPELLRAPGWTHQAVKHLALPATPAVAAPVGAPTAAPTTTGGPAAAPGSGDHPVLPVTGGDAPLGVAAALVAVALLALAARRRLA